MSAPLPSTIRIFLAEGRPEGLRFVEHSGWSGQGVVFHRAGWKTAKTNPELDSAGVYVLIGPDEGDAGGERVYIGETDSLLKRLPDHIRNKPFWETVVFFASRDASINRGHLHYIESRLIEVAAAADRATLVNSNVGQSTSLSKADMADAERFLAEILTLLPILRVDVFTIPEPMPTGEDILTVTGVDAKGSGFQTPAGFVVVAGSLARSVPVPSLSPGYAQIRTRLLVDGVLEPEGSAHLRFTKDHVFTSPSAAAAVLLGRPANGRTEWIGSGGRSLAEIEEESA